MNNNDLCQVWLSDPTVNPKTNRKIVPGGPTWKRLSSLSKSLGFVPPPIVFPKNDQVIQQTKTYEPIEFIPKIYQTYIAEELEKIDQHKFMIINAKIGTA